MFSYCYLLSILSNIDNAFGTKPIILSNELDVPTDSIIEQLSKKHSITECTMKCLHHRSANCCGVGFLSEEMVDNGVWHLFTCFLLKNFECPSNNNAKTKLRTIVRVFAFFFIFKVILG